MLQNDPRAGKVTARRSPTTDLPSLDRPSFSHRLTHAQGDLCTPRLGPLPHGNRSRLPSVATCVRSVVKAERSADRKTFGDRYSGDRYGTPKRASASISASAPCRCDRLGSPCGGGVRTQRVGSAWRVGLGLPERSADGQCRPRFAGASGLFVRRRTAGAVDSRWCGVRRGRGGRVRRRPKLWRRPRATGQVTARRPRSAAGRRRGGSERWG